MSIKDVDHFVVLMLENRSFDHLLSSLRVDGADESMWNRDSTGKEIHVSLDADFEQDLIIDPGHDLADVNEQIFGNTLGNDLGGPYNQGFVTNYAHQPGATVQSSHHIMKCHSGEHVPVITTLAREFAFCTRWFSSVPGPTLPNRMFLHAAQSDNRVDMDPTGYSLLDTIFDRLNDAGMGWCVYAQGGVTITATLGAVLDACDERLRPFEDFVEDARSGALPFYSFIEPRYADYEDDDRLLALYANDQHPNHDIRFGEYLIADTYEALRDSPHWPRTALIVIYDEHGGTFDHIQPPRATPPTNGAVYVDPGSPLRFAWDRLGLRVPAVIVSPLIPRNTVDRTTTYDHTSVLATLRERDPDIEALTDRDRAAHTFGGLFTLDTPRTDKPTVKRPSISFTTRRATRSKSRLLSGHNMALVQLAQHLNENLKSAKNDPSLLASRGSSRVSMKVPAGVRTEADAAAFIRRSMIRFCPHFAGAL